MQMNIKEAFLSKFNTEPQLFRSPGRVNLIGEHTDYNDGFVLPAAIDKEIWFAIGLNNTNNIRLYSYDLNEELSCALRDVKPATNAWANYVLGVVAQYQQKGYTIKGFDLVFGGNIPMGAGLSSSAAVECGVAFALNQIFSFGLDKLELAKIAQKAEHEFAGVRCGIMDQFASLFGKAGNVLKLDCRSLDHTYYPFDMEHYRIVLCDTQVKHSLASSEYNTRRQECEEGVEALHKLFPEVKSLRDASLDMLPAISSSVSPVVLKRCQYVIEENLRVEAACNALLQQDFRTFGELMYASHDDLQYQYEVSCRELDFLVACAKELDTVLGARMMGGGFGGCTINIVAKEHVPEFIGQMKVLYSEEFKVELQCYVAAMVNGSSAL